MALERYHSRRDFARTPEPRGEATPGNGFSFVVQKHAARSLHYDFRLELDGVLLSWAVPKGPSLDPGAKRLAMQTEDHPIEYRDFEGVIPKGEYGAGAVLVWDRGRWIPEGDPHEAYRRGRLTFALEGEKLHGRFHLVRTRGRGGGKADRRSWLLFKSGDAAAERGSDTKLVDEHPESVISGRTLEQVARHPDRVWHSKEKAAERPAMPEPARLARARKAALPDFVEPQLATLVEAAPEGDAWLHELKLDGYRILARIDHGAVRLLTRRGNDWSARMPALARALAALPLPRALIDGELCVLRADGVSDFQRLQNALAAGDDEACTYFAFDLLYLGDRDLRSLPLRERKNLLREALAAAGAGERVRYNDHVQGDGPRFFARACALGVEGVVSKRADAPYGSGRSRAWLKLKCTSREEFVIGAYTEPTGSRAHFGALLLGNYDEQGALRYAGKVGTGFTQQSLAELHKKLARLEQKQSPFANAPRGSEARGVHWLRPELVAEVKYAERTADGLVRHASYSGLRGDKPAREVHAEHAEQVASSEPAPAPALAQARLRLSHPKRVLYPEDKITKAELAEYYLRVAAHMLPHVTGRPLALLRCPEGYASGCFFQKHPMRGLSRAIGRVRVKEASGSAYHLMVEDIEGLIALVQIGALEIHVWGARADRLEHPDRLVFDLDPDEGLPFARTIEAAREVRARLSELGLTAFVKTTGGKGLHVVVPIEPRASWDEAKQFSEALVDGMVRAEPEKYVATASKQKRKGKLFLDYLRNAPGATSVCAYSTRARRGAPVSAPLTWDELDEQLLPERLTLRSMPERVVGGRADPWQGFFGLRQALTVAMQRAAHAAR